MTQHPDIWPLPADHPFHLTDKERAFLETHMGEHRIIGWEETVRPLAEMLARLGQRGLIETPDGKFHYRSGITPELKYNASLTDAGVQCLELHRLMGAPKAVSP